MRIACPVDETQMIAETLAVAKAFMLFDTEEDEILSMETITPLYEKAVSVLSSHLVDTVICRNLDIKDMIDVITNATNTVLAQIENSNSDRARLSMDDKLWQRNLLEQKK